MDPELMILLCAIAVAVLGQAVACGFIARRRDKSFWVWFAVGFLLVFPIGLIATLLYTKDNNMF